MSSLPACLEPPVVACVADGARPYCSTDIGLDLFRLRCHITVEFPLLVIDASSLSFRFVILAFVLP
jgi:hypothetical protein